MAIKPLKNETELLKLIAAGDQLAFTQLFDAYYKPLGAYVFKLTQSLPHAEEVVQEVFIKLWFNRTQLSAIEHFTNYLFVLCRNKTYDTLRKLSTERLRMLQVEKVLNEHMAHDELSDPADNYSELIEQAVSRLPAQQQKIFRMSRYERLKHNDIAAQLQIAPGTVKKHIQAAVAAIRKDLGSNTDMVIVAAIVTTQLILF